MVARTLEAYDSEYLVVADGSPHLAPGSAIRNESDMPNGTIFQFAGGTPVTVALDDTSADQDVLEDDDYANHTITDGGGIVEAGMGVEAESLIYLRALDEFGNQTGPTITVTVYSQNNVYQDVWGFHSDTALMVGARYVKTGSSNIGTASYSSIAMQPVCFAKGTLIETPDGLKAVDRLRPGDMVSTVDRGPVPVRWVRCKTQTLVLQKFDQKPVLISAGSLGPGHPATDLIVSSQHRILVGGHNQLMNSFRTEAFAPAKALTKLRGVRYMKGKDRITWVHFACPRHEIVRANGCLAETLLLGPMAVRSLSVYERRALFEIFGEPAVAGAPLNGPPARPCLEVGTVRRQIRSSIGAISKHPRRSGDRLARQQKGTGNIGDDVKRDVA